eukprot:TRINITY_DN43231_c0_g1_i1.p1 TRINITY_DN43231_c0_g1~~TRINITY_DN43231_c0_g1_i1.p1  ORF type:complete len:602 (+),score=106.10 TRINITY_DN43231_c0_g1_i1:62-1807(+)
MTAPLDPVLFRPPTRLADGAVAGGAVWRTKGLGDGGGTEWVGHETPEGSADCVARLLFARRAEELAQEAAWGVLSLLPRCGGDADFVCDDGVTRHLLLYQHAASGMRAPRTLCVRLGAAAADPMSPQSGVRATELQYAVEHVDEQSGQRGMLLAVAVTRWLRSCSGPRACCALRSAVQEAARAAASCRSAPQDAVARWPAASLLFLYDSCPEFPPRCCAALVGTSACGLAPKGTVASPPSGMYEWGTFCDAATRLAFDLCALFDGRYCPPSRHWASVAFEARRGSEVLGRCRAQAPRYGYPDAAARHRQLRLERAEGCAAEASGVLWVTLEALPPTQGLAQHLLVEVARVTSLPPSPVPCVVVVRAEAAPGRGGSGCPWEHTTPSREASWQGESFSFCAHSAPGMAAVWAAVRPGKPRPAVLRRLPPPGSPEAEVEPALAQFAAALGGLRGDNTPPAAPSPRARKPAAAERDLAPRGYRARVWACAALALATASFGCFVLIWRRWGVAATVCVLLVLVAVPLCLCAWCLIRERRRLLLDRRPLRQEVYREADFGLAERAEKGADPRKSGDVIVDFRQFRAR